MHNQLSLHQKQKSEQHRYLVWLFEGWVDTLEWVCAQWFTKAHPHKQAVSKTICSPHNSSQVNVT